MYLTGRIRDVFCSYMRRNFLFYLGVSLIFLFGIVLGATAVKALSIEQKRELVAYLGHFITSLSHDSLRENHALIRPALWNHLKALLLIWLMGLTVIGIPVALAILTVKGFVIGFTVGFLAQQMVLKGVFFATIAVLPHNLIAVPAFIIASVAATSFSLLLIRKKLGHRNPNLWHCFLGYSFIMIAIAILLILAAFIEAYITPMLMQFLSRYFAAAFLGNGTGFI